MQKVLLIGYLGRDPEVRYSQQGTAVAQFSVATTERWKDKSGELQEHTEWFAVKTFGRRAEIAGEYLHKGSRVFLEGRKRTESWDDKQTGGKHFRDLVYVDKLEFLDSKRNGSGDVQPPVEGASEENSINDSDIPFLAPRITCESPLLLPQLHPKPKGKRPRALEEFRHA